jgi:antitoxin HicB
VNTDIDDLAVMTPAELAAAEARIDAEVAAARARPVDAELEARVAAALARSDAYLMHRWREPEGYFAVEAPDVPGCIGTGANTMEALADWRAAFAGWVESRLAAGQPIPEPSPPAATATHSGRFVVRLPRSLHARLVAQAAREGISLNQLTLAYLAEALGRRAS